MKKPTSVVPHASSQTTIVSMWARLVGPGELCKMYTPVLTF